jgi:phosphatidylglycerol:prolipoprotein diacylglycerol transferase
LHPVLLDFGKINVYSWGVMLAIGIIVAIAGFGRLFSSEGLEREKVVDIVFITVLAGLLGARIAYVLVYQ